MIKNKRTEKIIAFVLLVLCLTFIWGNSSFSSRVSGNISKNFTDMMDGGFLHLSENLVRKIAHFTEFAGLGMILGWLGLLYSQKGIHQVTLPLFCAVLAACVDETIQVFAPERGPSVLDVWLDSAGALFGIGILLLGHAVLMKRRNNKLEEHNS